MLPCALSVIYMRKRGLRGAILPSCVSFAGTFFFRWLVSERTLFWQYEKSLAKMDLTLFETRVVNVMHQMRTSELIIEKYDKENLKGSQAKASSESYHENA